MYDQNFGLIHSLNFDKPSPYKIDCSVGLCLTWADFLCSSARWIQTCPASSEVIYSLAGSCKNNCLNKCGLERQYWNIRYKWGKQNYMHTALTSSLARPGKQNLSHLWDITITCNPACFLRTYISYWKHYCYFYFFWNLLQRWFFLFQLELQKHTYLTQQAEGTTLKNICHSWMTSVASYTICLCSAPGKTSVFFYAHFCELY